MPSCISSSDNRVYVSLEQSYGDVAAITAQHRIPTVKLAARQRPVHTERRDKTGSRTFAGLPNRIRKETDFQLNTFMTAWTDTSAEPSHGPLFQAAMGGTPLRYGGGVVASVSNGVQISFNSAHGLAPGQAVSFGGEIRFAAAVPSAEAIVLNAPFSTTPIAGSDLGPTMTYRLATEVGSASLYDYWDPSTSVQRIVNGAAMNVMKIKVNGDFHEFEFSGPSKDLVDNVSFTGGLAGLTEFPSEPALGAFDYTIVPGHLGQIWMGPTASRFYTLTSAELSLQNNLDLRVREFGTDSPCCIVGGQRTVGLGFSVLGQDDEQTKALYQAARQRSPIGVMLQLGEQAGQLFGAYMPGMVPEVPEFNDSPTRLEWKFQSSRAQGAVDDELYVAFA